jgi:transferrin binding protein
MNMRLASVLVIAGSLLAGCNGNSGSGMTPVQFTSFSAVQNDQPTTASGVSQSANVVGSTQTTLNPVDRANSSAQFTYTGIGTPTPVITAFGFIAPGTNVSWSGSTVDCATLAPVCTASNSSSTGRVVNALDSSVAWNYQSFGYWLVTTSLSSTTLGAMSFGSPTAVSNMNPAITGASGTYNGRSGGAYVDPAGNLFTFSGTMNSTVDFVGRTITFNSTASQLTSVSGLVVPPSTSILTINTSLTYAPATNQFSGPVTAAGQGTGLNGTLNGTFYGPTAQEMGGTFSLNAVSPSREAMVGGFGGKR